MKNKDVKVGQWYKNNAMGDTIIVINVSGSRIDTEDKIGTQNTRHVKVLLKYWTYMPERETELWKAINED